MSPSPPSTSLPALHPLPSPSSLLAPISSLTTFLSPSSSVVDLRPPVSSYNPLQAEEEQEADEFEARYAKGWLERVVALGARQDARGEEGEGWERVVESAARVLAGLLGPSAQGSVTKTYLLPRATRHLETKPSETKPSIPSFPYPSPPPTRPASTVPFDPSHPVQLFPPPTSSDIALTIRDGTLVEASTGHRTWGAATLFSHRLASSPSTFLPLSPSDERPLRVLELGSGTGLVGLATAKVLQALDVPARVVLTDGGDEPDTVLANLGENVEANFPLAESADSCVKVDVQRLDWRDYLPASLSSVSLAHSHSQAERYDLLLGTDLAYERGQATLLHSAVAGLLRFPSHSLDQVKPVFWLTIALRPTHAAEIAEVDSLFPSSSSSPLDPSLSRHYEGKAYRLVTTATEEMVGPDGFAGRAVRGRMAARGEMRYRIYKVEWEEVGRA
ncbi:hypothetical protein NBRC10512_003864 [Rhodotorula toruloides]|uniref:RHTO0S01e05182g1_1 n=2 Tax=Rhodotorula toruloides TaxID=5286 RepID=A0A061ADU0_RHOTO|nr:glucose-inducible SAM-dependent methyltransferase [Rhodotorula toruloides NP11]EMS21810.1 glucose-inducible SAM-dependent methyltransferase [Rhodotorula toruloides NP11]CDR35700.1 RHTO0S01e05182g1_1 [Rhodotorula toruloides]